MFINGVDGVGLERVEAEAEPLDESITVVRLVHLRSNLPAAMAR